MAAIKRGGSVNKKTKVVRRKMKKHIINNILGENTVAAYENIFVLCMLISAVRRSGEVLKENWKIGNWLENDEIVIMKWPRYKTKQSTVF